MSRLLVSARCFTHLLSLTLLAGCSAPDGGSEPGLATVQQALDPGDEFVTRAGSELRVGDTAFYYSGTNNYYLWYAPFACGSSNNKCVDEVLADAYALGHTVIRTWGFADGGGSGGWEGFAFQPEPGVYDEATFAHFDQVVANAKTLGLRLIIPLVNNWDDFGGMNQYVSWCGGTGHDDFYLQGACKTLYKNYVSYFLNRVNTVTGVAYKDEPAIMAWELANEPRAQDTNPDVLTAWIEEMAAHVKSIDTNHLLGTGSEGFYNGRSGFSGWQYDGSQGVDFMANHADPNIDLVSIHAYPDHWGFDALDTLEWFNVHIDDARHVLGKPIIIGEFGKSRVSPSDLALRDELMTDWYQLFEDNNVAGTNYWILYGDDYPDYDNYGVYYPGDASTVTIIDMHSQVMNAKAGQNTLVREVALAESNLEGTVAGDFSETHQQDDIDLELTEQQTNGAPSKRRSTLQHTFQTWVTKSSDAPVFHVDAYTSGGVDAFSFEYSTDGANFTPMLVVNKTSDDGSYQTFTLPDTARERVYIRVVDTNDDQGETTLDTLYIDHMFIEANGIDVSTDVPPVVALTAPDGTASVTGQVPVLATASDDDALTAVEYAIDGGPYQPMANTGGDSYSALWDASLEAQGSWHTISVRATDSIGQTAGDSVAVFVDHNPGDPDPIVSIASPGAGELVSGDVVIDAIATDDGGISSVDFSIDGGAWQTMSLVTGDQYSATWDSTLVPDGNHEISVLAIDSVGQPTLQTVTVQVANVASLLVHIDGISMSGKQYGRRYQARADVLIVDNNGAPAPGVTVVVNWSGANQSKVETVTTDSSGVASSYSGRGDAGTYLATVGDVSCGECFYDSAANVEIFDTITLP